MPIYIKGVDGSDSNLSLLGVSGAQQRFSYWHSGQIDADANSLAGLEQFLRRVTVSSSTSDSPANKSSTRSPTERATPRNASTWTVVGSPLVCLAIGETHLGVGFWRPPRPWASPVIFDTEQFGLDRPFRAQSCKYGWDEDGPIARDLCRPTRRPRRRGLWTYSNHKSFRQLSKNGYPKIRSFWCAPYDMRFLQTRPAHPAQVSTGTDVNFADAGSGVDSYTLTAFLTAADSGAGTDTAAYSTTVSGSDAGAGSEALSLAAALALGETGSGSDTGGVGVAATASDSGVGSDAGTLAAQLSMSDTGAGSDGASVSTLGNPTFSDFGSGVDSVSVVVKLTASDAGSGADTATMTAAASISETGSGVTGASSTAAAAISDIGSGLDSFTSPAASVQLVESGSGLDLFMTLVALSVQDSGSALDTAFASFGAVIGKVSAGRVLQGRTGQTAHGDTGTVSRGSDGSATGRLI